MKKFYGMEKEWKGIDRGLDYSLFDYGLAYTRNEYCSDNEVFCCAKIDVARFVFTYIDFNDIADELESGWLNEFRLNDNMPAVELAAFLRSGLTSIQQKFLAFYDIYNHYGYIEFFGDYCDWQYIYDENELESLLDKMATWPAGSGIDCSYDYEIKKNSLVINNSWHCMNNDGFYDGYIDYKLIIPFNDPRNFKIQFTDYNNHRQEIKKYGYSVRDYLNDTYCRFIYDNLDMFMEAGK